MLVNYSSSGEEEEENPEHEAEQCFPKAEDSQDNAHYHQSPVLESWEPPSLQPRSDADASGCNVAAAAEMRRHESRVRTFPHVEGMYPTLVMIPVPLGAPELEALASCIHHLQQLLPGQLHPMVPQLQQCRPDHHHHVDQQQQQQQQQPPPPKQTMHASLKRPRPQVEEQSGDLHISLSHCVPVRFADLELLVGHLRDSLQPCQRPDRVSLEGLSTFCNTECTRTFLSVPVVQGAKQVVAMTKAVDRSFSVLGLRTFHKDPRPHMSIAWMLGDQRNHLEQAIKRYQQQQSQQCWHQSQQRQPQLQQEQQHYHHHHQVLWPPGKEPGGQEHVGRQQGKQQQQQQQLGPSLPSSCQWQGQTQPRHGALDARHIEGELSVGYQPGLPERSAGQDNQSEGSQREVAVGVPNWEQSVECQHKESRCGSHQEQSLEGHVASELAGQRRARQEKLENGDGSVEQGRGCLPWHSFLLQVVLCRTAQKEHVVWGDYGSASKAGSSQKRRK